MKLARAATRRPAYPTLIASLGLLLVGGLNAGCERSPGEPFVAIEVEARANVLDGCTSCGCRAPRAAVDASAPHTWWFTFGTAEPDDERGWKATGSPSHCGSGPFEKVVSDFRRVIGTPYVTADLSVGGTVARSGDTELELRLVARKLSGFDAGQPTYETRVQTRRLRLASGEAVPLPVFLPHAIESESFAVHEVLLHLRASSLGRGPAAAYGSLSVAADVPGAEILLDGGFVGRVSEASPTLLSNVPAGTREVRIRDFSSREARREVVVEQRRTAAVSLEVLDLTGARPSDALVPVGENPQGHLEYWRGRDGALVVTIPAGEFLMGSSGGRRSAADELPQHRVWVSEFLIDKTEVTWRQFRKFAADTGAAVPRAPVSGAPDDYPASFLLWEEASAYCRWVGGRLPTEAEWEKAARGTDGREYPWGDRWDPRRCNSISGGRHQPESAGSHPTCASPYGVLDMPGSMWEWCADWYGESYYAESPLRDPEGPDSGSLRVKRGGAWMSQPNWLRAAHRSKASPTSRNADHGFRCAHDPPEQR